MLTPSDPTMALAALIAGNQRHVDRRIHVRAPSVSARLPLQSARPFALMIEFDHPGYPANGRSGHHAEHPSSCDRLSDTFDVSAEQLHSFVLAPGSSDAASGRFEVVVSSQDELLNMVDGSVAALGCSLVVVLGHLTRGVGVLEVGFQQLELRSFELIGRFLSTPGVLVTSVITGRVRVVGAIVDQRDGRVHWIGEHPEQRALLAAMKRSK